MTDEDGAVDAMVGKQSSLGAITPPFHRLCRQHRSGDAAMASGSLPSA
jgi:hypothetical protein